MVSYEYILKKKKSTKLGNLIINVSFLFNIKMTKFRYSTLGTVPYVPFLKFSYVTT